MKRGLLGFPLIILLIQFTSAQFFGGYNGFSIENFFNNIDSSTMILGLLFFIFFALLFYALSRVFKNPYGEPNKGIAGTIAFALSMLIIYGIHRSGFSLRDLFYGFGISEGVLYWIGLIIFIAFAALLIKKIRFFGFLMVFGLIMIVLTIFTEIFYVKGLPLVIGIILLLIGLWLWKRRRWPRQPREPRLPREPKVRPPREPRVKSPRRGFQYTQGMRRGGSKPTRARFVKKDSVERYAHRFGRKAAKKRFG